jgi:hypothetical protein
MNKSPGKSKKKLCVYVKIDGKEKRRVVHFSVRKDKYYYIEKGKRVYTNAKIHDVEKSPKKSVKRSASKKSVKRSASKKSVKRSASKKSVKRSASKKSKKGSASKKSKKGSASKKSVKRSASKKSKKN